MPLKIYVPKKFTDEHQTVIERANTILEAMAARGYDLTLRQLYYQFVSQNWLANNDKSYKRLGTIISDARRAGLIDWDHIVDRTRHTRQPPSWGSPAAIVAACAGQFNVDWWAGQPYRPEVWIEKDALVGVLEVACAPWQCPYLSCRGYTSDSEIWSSAQRMRAHAENDQTPIVFHLGDHDPSGIDMSRDIQERLNLFGAGGACQIEVRRIALTMQQVEEVQPPPNPAKQTDSRFTEYAVLYGDESWELDALNPEYIGNLIRAEMEAIIETEPWDAARARMEEGRRLLGAVSNQWAGLTDGL